MSAYYTYIGHTYTNAIMIVETCTQGDGDNGCFDHVSRRMHVHENSKPTRTYSHTHTHQREHTYIRTTTASTPKRTLTSKTTTDSWSHTERHTQAQTYTCMHIEKHMDANPHARTRVCVYDCTRASMNTRTGATHEMHRNVCLQDLQTHTNAHRQTHT